MISIILGLMVGLIMGLSGAGGGLVAIPLFIKFLGVTLKEASSLSLIVVGMSSLMNLIIQRKYVLWKIGLGLLPFTALGSLLMIPWKAVLNDGVVIAFLVFISLFALSSTWLGSNNKTVKSYKRSEMLILISFIGLCVGGLTTLTGIGGGVLLVPSFILFLGLNNNEAMATSLTVIFFTSVLSFLVQWENGLDISLESVEFLGLGVILSLGAFLLMSKKINPIAFMFIRKITFSIIVFFVLVFFYLY